MKCSNIRKWFVEVRDGAVPVGVQEHLDSCADCRAFREQTDALRALLSLKTYERPDEGFEMRSRSAIRQAIAEASERDRAGSPEMVFDFGRAAADTAFPAVRYALATVILAMVAMHLLLVPSMPLMQSQLPQMPSPVRAAVEAPIPVTNLAMEIVRRPSVPAFRVASNRGPSGVRYGPARSSLVSFDR